MSKQSLPKTTNECYGFYGSMNNPAAWDIALLEIAYATGSSYDDVQAFLDSRHGRHFADEVLSIPNATITDAIKQATNKWMQYTISSRTSKDYGIPKGLPYLTGFVIQCGLEAQLQTN